MISDKHNFRKNFSNATGVNDDEMALDVLLNEINEQIIENPLGVIGTLHQSGVKVSETASSRKLAKLVCENMGTNKDLQKKMMTLILTREGNEYLHTDGGKKDIVLSPELAASVDKLSDEAGKLIDRAYKTKVVPEKVLTMLSEKEKQRGLKTGLSILQGVAIWGTIGATAAALIWAVSSLGKTNTEQTAIVPVQ